jgi:hypothetical protein
VDVKSEEEIGAGGVRASQVCGYSVIMLLFDSGHDASALSLRPYHFTF